MRVLEAFSLEKTVFLVFCFAVASGSLLLLATPYYPLALLPGLGLLAMLLLGQFPRVGFYILVFLIPFQGYTTIMMVSGQGFFTYNKILGFWIILVIVLAILIHKRVHVNLSSKLWKWFALLFVFGLLSSIASTYPLTSFHGVRRLIADFTFFALTLVFVSDKRTFSTVLPAVIITSVNLSCFLSLAGYYFDLPYFSMHVSSAYATRITGAAHEPNILVSFIIFSLVLQLHWFIKTDRLWLRALLLGLSVMGITAAILTYSRSGFLILVAVLAMLFFAYARYIRPKHIGFITAFVTLAFLASLAFVPQSFWVRQSTITHTRTDPSIARRISYLHVAWEEVGKRPLFGAGYDTFRDIYGKTAVAQRFAKDESKLRRVAHNTYVEFLVGSGLFGFSILCIILFVGYKSFRRAEKNFRGAGNDTMASLTRAYKFAYVTFLLTFFFLSSFDHKYFWLALGISQAALFLSTLSGDDVKDQEVLTGTQF